MDYSNIVFPEQMLNYISVGGMLMISAVVIISFILLMRYSANLLPGFLALLMYLVISYVGVEVLVMVVAMIPGINAIALGTNVSYCITKAVLFALMLHLTRWIVLKFYNRNSDLELGNSMMTGLGVALGQTIIVGMDMIAWWVVGSDINQYGINKLIEGMTTEQIQQYVGTIEGVLQFPVEFFLLKGIGYTIDIVFQVAVCVILYGVVKKGVPTFWHIIIIVLNAVLNLTTNLGDFALVEPLYILTIIKAVVLVIVIIVALKQDREWLNGELRSFSKLKTVKSMPKFNNLKNK